MSGKFNFNGAAWRSLRACSLLPGLFLGLPCGTFAADPLLSPAPPAENPIPATTDPGDAIAAHFQELFTRTRGAVVRVEARNGPFEYVGTGFFVDPSGALLTNYLVGGESTDIVVNYGDMKFPAKRLLADARTGIALLKVEGGKSFPFLLPGASTKLQAATPVMLVGYPLNLPVSPSLGLVAAFDIESPGCLFATSCIRASVPVQNGEAGGPLLNMRGEVVGIVVKGQPNHAGVFALPIEAAEKMRRDYTRFGEVRPGQVGIIVERAFTDGRAPAAIASFVKDSPAATSGLEKGDIITSLGGKKIARTADLLDASYFLSPGDAVALVVDRHGTTLSFNIEAIAPRTALPEEADLFQPRPPGVLMRTSQ